MRRQTSLPVLLGGRIRDLRRAAELTQQEFAEKAGVNVKYLGELENGHRDVRLGTMERIAKALRIEVSQLFFFTELDVTAHQIGELLHGRDEVFRAHVLRLLRDALLLVDVAK